MKKSYFVILFFTTLFFASQNGFSQNNNGKDFAHNNIENLSIYPNPVTNNQTVIYINSKNNLTKKIEFYDILGKLISTTYINRKELNIAHLNRGVYILKITENNITEVKKLVIK
ncbi:T9SS type A sorting domain-containing protein [Siansivirga zeaxanthinifaciens]|uniref:Secretion system C-terminal sorting domain-containing protein n=1 Tax=Siansivirga zeaxanthinifaciens CC-SAMT-1 TaxID=1454006 RepID=A0A0C5VTV0_9FLAO|nr:T9SS type A sorting domain-containing protein [Siansivirga zeaxanthinifaciens]AJR02626.1 hypothetical protein AW14_02180 [Siansivirga zeaxanthinifaciens CC-SAMT-1]